ncbi:hypothetical protein ACEPAI_2358 [Sanghuangporus weigelae]
MSHFSRIQHSTGSQASEPCGDVSHGIFTSREDIVKLFQRPGYAIPEIDTTSFLNNLLPPLSDETLIEGVISSLKDEGVIDARGSWKDGAKLWQEMEFVALRHVFEKSVSISCARAIHLEQTIRLMLPDCSLKSQLCSQRSSYFVLMDKEERSVAECSMDRNTCSWFSVAIPVALRECDFYEDQTYNTSKLITGVQKIMARDPCRRHTFGITIEKTSMRLWFFSRGTPVVSKAFDLVSEAHLLIHVFLSLAFASKEELGWDPTIRPFIRDDGKRAYYIDVDDKTYETKDVLADNVADVLVSHATRVWIVNNEGSEEPLVLKDVWVEDGRELEHIIYESILHDVEEKYGTDVRKEVASHLLTPIAHCLVPIRGEEDHTTKVMMRGYSPSFNNKLSIDVKNIAVSKSVDRKELSASDVSIQDSENGHFGAPFPGKNQSDKIIHKRHYRIVFKEVATGIYSIRTLSDMLTVLSDSAAVLKWIHGCGWVHRDLSIGNLYWYHGRGLIGDFEYAKRKNQDVEHELRTGTPDFMAVEASRREFIYLPERCCDVPDLDDPAWHEKEEVFGAMQTFVSCPPFFHHDIHDLESLWWIAVWIFFTYFVAFGQAAEEGISEEQHLKRRHIYERIFPRNGRVDDRGLFLDNRRLFELMVLWIPRHLFRIKNALNALRGLLTQKYREFESKFPETEVHLFDEVHDMFRVVFTKCRETFRDAELTPYLNLQCPGSGERGHLSVPCCPSKETAPVKDGTCQSNRLPKERALSCLVRKRKREQDAENARSSMRPLRIPRLELEVC